MRGFDAGSASLGISVITFVVLWVVIEGWAEDSKRITRLEDTFRAYCAGAKKIEVCAKLDLPLELRKFDP